MPFGHIPSLAGPPRPLFDSTDMAAQRLFFSHRPSLAPTPLHPCPELARRLGVGALLVKDETARFGLNAFKAAGAIYAVTTLRERGELRAGDVVACASEGNHGRAVARAAREAGCQTRVYMAESVAASRVEAIAAEGGDVVLVEGSYDDAVRQAADDAARHGWTIVSDTSWEGYEQIPRLIMLGYTRLLDEAESAWSPAGRPDVIFVPGGVGGLLAAVASWCSWRFGAERPRVVAVEPVSAACLLTSARHGQATAIPGPFDTVMGGLRCGEVSPAAFPAIRSIVDAYVAIEDGYALDAIRLMARPGGGDPAVKSGASGAAALGGLLATLTAPELEEVKAHLNLGPRTRVMVIASEGVTDPAVFDEALARAGTASSHERTPARGSGGTFGG